MTHPPLAILMPGAANSEREAMAQAPIGLGLPPGPCAVLGVRATYLPVVPGPVPRALGSGGKLNRGIGGYVNGTFTRRY